MNNLICLLLALLPGPPSATDAVDPPGARVDGRVLDAHGAPVAGALVLLTRLDRTLGALSYSMRRSALTRADGRFAFSQVEPSAWLLDARDETDWLPLPVRVVVADADVPGVLLHLEPASRIAGTVLDPDGAPIPFARIAVGDGGLQAALTDPVAVVSHPALELERLPRGMTYPRLPVESVLADAEGRFEIAPILPGTDTSLRIYGVPPFHDRSMHGIQGHPGRTVHVEARLLRGATIAGSVIAHDGQPRAGARVGLFALEAGEPAASHRWLVLTRDSPRFLGTTAATRLFVDERGSFLLEGLDAGRYRVCADAPGCDPAWSPIIQVQRPGERVDLQVTLLASRAR